MKIGVVVPRLDGGGTAQCVVDLTNGLVDAGLDPVVVCLERIGYVAEKIRRDVEIIGPLKKRGNDPTAPFRLAAILKEQRCDVVHGHNWGGLVDTVLAAKLTRLKAVLHTQHGMDYGFTDAPDHLRSRLRTLAKTIACRGISRIATVSEEVAQMVTREWGMPAARVSVVHNGVRVPPLDQGHEMRAHWRRELSIGDDEVLIGTVATFRPVKDLHTLLEATACVVKVKPEARLVLFGDGPLRADLTATIERLGLGSVVRLPGWRRDATQLLPAMDVFVLSSVSEGISLALLEAMAAGVPVVATRVGGNVEVLNDPCTGLLVPPRSPADLADAILRLIDDPVQRRQLSAGGRRRVEAAFSLKRMVNEYERLYTSLVGTGLERAAS